MTPMKSCVCVLARTPFAHLCACSCASCFENPPPPPHHGLGEESPGYGCRHPTHTPGAIRPPPTGPGVDWDSRRRTSRTPPPGKKKQTNRTCYNRPVRIPGPLRASLGRDESSGHGRRHPTHPLSPSDHLLPGLG
jgi:hypothetical protein